MKPQVPVLVAAVLVVGLTGCSSDDKGSTDAQTSTTQGSSTDGAGEGSVQVTINKTPRVRPVEGTVSCSVEGDTVNLAVSGPQSDGFAVRLTDGNPPTVQSIELGGLASMSIQYKAGGGGKATATKSDKSYTITGQTAQPNPPDPLRPAKSFDIDVTCP